MHGQKKRRKRSMEGAFELEGEKLVWRLVSEPQITTEDGHKGLCVEVRLKEGAHRALTIEYPYDRSTFVPQRPKLTPAIVEADTSLALSQGWAPTSRGRAFVYRSAAVLQPRGRPVPRLSHLAGR